MKYRAGIVLLFSASLFAAEFQSGQAARAVLGQSSFTSLDQGIQAASLVVERGRLYAADSSHHLLTFDLSKVPDVRNDFAARSPSGCSVCGLTPLSVTNESVMPGVSTVSVWGKSVAVADPVNHRVFLWQDSRSPRPDVVLGRTNESSPSEASILVNPVSVALDGKRVFVGDAALHRVLIWNSFPSSDDQPADVVLGQADFSTVSAADSPGPDSIALPSAMVSDGTNLFVADPVDRRILVFSPGDRALDSGAVVNAASLVAGPLAPGTLIAIDGTGFSEGTESADTTTATQPLPRHLNGTEIIFNGQALPLLEVSPSQVQAQLPYDLGSQTAGSLYIRTEHSSGAISVTTPVSVKLVAGSPGLFGFSGTEPRSGILLHAGLAKAGGNAPITDDSPAKPGEVITVLATGLGAVSDSAVAGTPFEGKAAAVVIPVSAEINGQSAQVVSATLPAQAIGVYQVEIAIPDGLERSAISSLSVVQDGYSSNTVTFPLR